MPSASLETSEFSAGISSGAELFLEVETNLPQTKPLLRYRASMAADARQNGQTASSQVPLRFVNLDRSNLGRDPSTKKIVRSHVMQRYRRGKAMNALLSPSQWKDKKKSQNAQHVSEDMMRRFEKAGYLCKCSGRQLGTPRRRSSQKLTSAEIESTREIISSPLFTVCAACGGCIRAAVELLLDTNPTTILGAGKTDPFNTLPLTDHAQSFYFLDHYSHVVLGLSLPMDDYQIKWFKRALGDEVLLHSLLLYAAKHNEIITGDSKEVEIYAHRGEVMRIVNERIRSGHDDVIDTTIDAVACLVLFEEMFGDHDVANAHRAGLEQLVMLRGGLIALGVGSSLYKLVVWARMRCSPKPLWEMANLKFFPSDFSPISIQEISPLPLSCYNSIPLINFNHLPGPQIEIFCRLRNSSVLMSSVHSRLSPNPQILSPDFTPTPSSSSQLAGYLERNEQYILRARLCEELDIQQALIPSDRQVAWLIAAILYTARVLSFEISSMSLPDRREVMKQLVERLQEFLIIEAQQKKFSQEEGNIEDIYAPSVLFWIIFLGGTTSSTFELPQKEWFRTTLGELSNILGVNNWVEVRSMMRELPWSEEIIGAEWKRWWEISTEEVKV